MRVIGLISGTSVDGIDAAMVSLDGPPDALQVSFVGGETFPYPAAVRSRILELCGGAVISMAEFAELDEAIAQAFADAALQLQTRYGPADLIGSHGQTVFHRPRPLTLADTPSLAYTLQLGRGDWIAYRTGLLTVNNFRQADVEAGGEGAPLVPPVDVALLRDETCDRCIQNIGGIGNVAYLPSRQSGNDTFLGWDTGPGNSLLDLAVQQLSGGQQRFDQNGAWAAQGTPCQPLVQHWLAHSYFQQVPPKSTGRELFGPDFLARCWQEAQPYNLTEADFLATLTELTAASIADSYRRFLPQLPDEVLVCGGGSRNPYLLSRLQNLLPSALVKTTDDAGIDADFKEAIAFAVLAYWRISHYPGNLPAATGARQAVVLGEIHLPPGGTHVRMRSVPEPFGDLIGTP
ncbi:MULTISPECIES: anhydro-N-acetylmuramic acid kinase [unclassified Leptolyngbya]|uniref:anhydro-N-acetylmuramic acid kinase n=1 Tax=unclassified Leptolyngbya TaxID=2650499 RepID=UPI0016827E93|nr:MULTISPECIES: anhydro-N-acetylmuramic acid kinase [unclassified Leptolyngbya]MBD1910548.1 anhydro-N-acetylmuramic acid kinase [Leptolyngbya sp. FACHB-8]MBD2153919.1 anhydro-N-acetylmuramic acid kinase [Leptolyngbya sp. FACHB-16]